MKPLRDSRMEVAPDAAKVTTTPSFSFRSPTPLLQDPNLVGANYNQIQYDVSADSQRFVLVGMVESEEDKAPSFHVVENSYEEFRDRE